MIHLDTLRPLMISGTTDRVRKAVSPVLREHQIGWAIIISYDRRAAIVRARWEVYKALHDIGMSASQIGRIVSRDHTTVLHGLKRLANDL